MFELSFATAVACSLCGVGFCVRQGWQRLRVVRALEREQSLEDLEARVGELVAIEGAPVRTGGEEDDDPEAASCVWYRHELETRDPEKDSWRTLRVEEPRWRLALDVGGGRVAIAGAPTALIGSKPSIRSDGGDRYRTVMTRIPITPVVTACGRLERAGGALQLVPDPRVGLSLAGERALAQADRERASVRFWLLVAAPATVAFSLLLAGLIHLRMHQ